MAPITNPVTVDLFITTSSMRTAAAHSMSTAAIFNETRQGLEKCRSVVTRRRWPDPREAAGSAALTRLVQAPDLQRREFPARVALYLERDRVATDLAILHEARLIGGEVDAPLQALAAIRATHRHELLGRHARRCRARLPDRLEAIEPIDAVRVEARDPPPQALEFGGLASLHRSSLASSLRGGVANCDAALNRQARIRQYADRPCRRSAAVHRRRHDSGRVRREQTVAGCAGGRQPGRRLEAQSRRRRRPAESAGPDARRGLQAHGATGDGHSTPAGARRRPAHRATRPSAARG